MLLGVCLLPTGADASGLRVAHHSVRQDRLAVPADQWQWNEGWPEIRQFFPRYFKPAATLHMFVENRGDEPVDITDVRFDGQPISEVCTRAEFAGPVIWYRSNPEVLQPGQIGMIYARLRHAPEKPIRLSVNGSDGQEVAALFDKDDRDEIRLGYVGFNQEIDRAYVYVEDWTGRHPKLSRVLLDGRDVTAQCELINADFVGGPALVELSLDEPLEPGSFHCLAASTAEGMVAVSQIRARGARYRLGVWNSGVEKCYAKFFNVSYIPSSFSKEHGWWDPDTEENQLGFATTGFADDVDQIRYMATLPADRFIYTNFDEPDAHEPGPLPYMSRCGINIMRKVEPLMVLQRRYDPRHDTTFVCNRTYAPLNWLHYGEVPDIFISDCYVPARWMGYDMLCVPMQMRTVAAAAAPRPADMMLWGCMNTGYQMKRSPTPQENDMVVHYAMAEGAKGLYYFCDWNSYPMVSEGGYFIGASSTNMQWKNMGRMNAEITRIAPLLSKGHPFQIAESDNDQLYVRSLLCGRDNFVVVMVNRSHRIHGPTNNKGAMQPFIFPVDEATVTLNVPSWFKVRSAAHVAWDGARPVKLESSPNSGTASLGVRDLMTSMVLVLSQQEDIAGQLTVPEEQFNALLAAEQPTYVTDNPPIPDVTRPKAFIRLDDAAVEQGQLTLDLTQPDSLAQASSITTEGELRQVPGEWLGLFTPPDWHGEASIVFQVESAVPLQKVQAVLESSTPNIAACANNAVGITLEQVHYTEDMSFKMQWPGHGKLTATRAAEEGESISRFFVRVQLRDPGIVHSDEATNLARSLTISWTK